MQTRRSSQKRGYQDLEIAPEDRCGTQNTNAISDESARMTRSRYRVSQSQSLSQSSAQQSEGLTPTSNSETAAVAFPIDSPVTSFIYSQIEYTNQVGKLDVSGGGGSRSRVSSQMCLVTN